MNENLIYNADGANLNTSEWDVYNTQPELVSVEQNNSLNIHVRDWAYNPSLFAEKLVDVTSKKKASTGYFSLSAYSMLPSHSNMAAHPLYSTLRFGIKIDDDNRIEFYHKLEGGYNLAYRIVKGGVTVHEVVDVAKEFVHVKFAVTLSTIKAYIWDNEDWAQIGTTYTYADTFNKPKCVFAAGNATSMTKLSMRDISITQEDFITATAVSQSVVDATHVPALLTDITASVNTALQSGNVILQNGRYLIGSGIVIPSNRTLYIRSAVLRAADGSFDNIFRNANPDTGNTNVNVIGLGNAVLDGNMENNFINGVSDYGSERYKAQVGFLCNVTNFEISGLDVVNKPLYFMTLQKSSFGSIHDITFNYYYMGTDGAQYSDRDGIQTIWGSHDIEMYNFRGFTGDDFVSIYLGVGAVPATLYYDLGVGFQYGDCYNINWHDFVIYSCGHSLNLIISDGNKIYDIAYKNAIIRGSGRGYMEFGYQETTTVSPTKDEFYNIEIINVRQVSSYPVYFKFQENMKNVNIVNFTRDNITTDYEIAVGKQLENVVFNGTNISTI